MDFNTKVIITLILLFVLLALYIALQVNYPDAVPFHVSDGVHHLATIHASGVYHVVKSKP